MSELNHKAEVVDSLRRRARRRLIGAIFLVLVTLGLLWKSMHQVPQVFKPELIRITASSAVDSALLGETDASLTTMDSPVVEPVDYAKKTENLSNLSKTPSSFLDKSEKTDVAKQNVAKNQVTQSRKKILQPIVAKINHQATREINKPFKALEKTNLKTNTQPSELIMVQLAALSNPKLIEALKQKLAKIGIYATFTQVKTSNGKMVRIRIGPFSSHIEAEQIIRRLAQHGIFGTILH